MHVEYSPRYIMLGHRTSLSELKKIEIISSTFSSDNSIKLDVRGKKWKKHKQWSQNNMLVNNKSMKKSEEIKYLETNENKIIMVQNLCNTAEAA